jgi:hypothetical protein
LPAAIKHTVNGMHILHGRRLIFAVGVLALGLVATAPAHADYAIVKFKSGYCRIYDNTAWAPPDGTFVWFVWGHHRYYRLPTLGVAQHKLGLVVARHLCWHVGLLYWPGRCPPPDSRLGH